MNFDWKKIVNIVIINPFGIGDCLFTTPLIRSLKEELPWCSISFICNARTAEMFFSDPSIENVFVYERDDWRDLWQSSKIRFFVKTFKFLDVLKKKKFDLCIDLSLSGNYCFLMWLIGVKKRTGFNYKNRSFFLNYKIPLKGYQDKHIVEYYLDFLRLFGLKPTSRKLELSLSSEHTSWAEGFLDANSVSIDDLLIAVFPGGGASWGKDATIKHWGAKGFAGVIQNLTEKNNAKVIIFGDTSEISLCQEVVSYLKDKNRIINACGKAGLMQTAAILSKCKIAITSDGGPLHLAVALGKKTVSIFGPVDDRVYGPYPGEGHIVIKKDLDCRPCYKNFRMPQCPYDRRCLKEIKPEDVFKAVETILQ